MTTWSDALLGFQTDGNGVLSAYARCLRLISGLSSSPPMEWLTDRARASLNPELTSSLANDPAVIALRRRLLDADEVTASVLRHLCTVQSGTAAPGNVGNAMRSLARTLDPNLCLQAVMDEESRVAEAWADALGLPPGITLPFRDIRRMESVGRSGAATLLCGENMSRVRPLFDIRHGQGWNFGTSGSGQSQWVADLVPPHPYCAVFGTESCDKTTPLEVLNGCVQDMPVWQMPLVIPFPAQPQVLRDGVVRFVPSGACIVEEQGTEICMPTSWHSMAVPPSMVANTVVTTGVPEFIGRLCIYQTAEVGLAWPATLNSDTPWRHFVAMARDEALFRKFETERKESGVGENLFDATRTTAIDPKAGGGSSKIRKKRKVTKDEVTRDSKRLRQDMPLKRERVEREALASGSSPTPDSSARGCKNVEIRMMPNCPEVPCTPSPGQKPSGKFGTSRFSRW
eukprot:s1600_g16.t1